MFLCSDCVLCCIVFVCETDDDDDDDDDDDCNGDDVLCLTNDQCSPISVFVAVMLDFLCFVWVWVQFTGLKIVIWTLEYNQPDSALCFRGNIH